MADISKVTIPSGTYDIKDATARTQISNLATVATTGSYNDLIDKPSSCGSYTAGDGIDITNNVVSNTAGMYTENFGAYSGSPAVVNADLLEGHDSSYFMQAGSTIDADLLEGHDSSYFAKASDVVFPSRPTTNGWQVGFRVLGMGFAVIIPCDTTKYNLSINSGAKVYLPNAGWTTLQSGSWTSTGYGTYYLCVYSGSEVGDSLSWDVYLVSINITVTLKG